MKRIIAILLCLCMAVVWLPMGTTAEESEPATIEEQIRAFADSIDQSNAVDDAAWALAGHGMTKGGRKLSVGKSHALTATLFNSEFLQYALIDGCTAAIQTMQQLDLSELPYVYGTCGWYGTASNYSGMTSCDTDDFDYLNWDAVLSVHGNYSGPSNAYDDALEWMAGSVNLFMQIQRTKRTADTATYKVTYSVSDRFDFNTSSNSVFKGLISGIGALFFKEFEWESKVSFELTVPYACSHISGAYRLVYDAENRAFTSDNADGCQENEATRLSYKSANGEDTYYYYQLENTVRLLHDRPWVLEYDVSSSGNFVMSPLKHEGDTWYRLLHSTVKYLFISDLDRVIISQEGADDQNGDWYTMNHHYGTALDAYFSMSYPKEYTLRLENEVRSDCSNMIYLTVLDTETGKVCMEHVPMDDYYRRESWNKNAALQDESNSWVSGKDLYINYLGNRTYPFGPGSFEMRIWENGENGEAYSYYGKSTVTAPTCTKRGYTTYICSACGHSKKADYVAATGHSWGDWENISDNLRQRTCTACGETEQEEISVLYGDANGDGEVNALDLILLRQYLAGWDVEPDLNAADANGDGTVNALDLILLRQFLAGWDVTLGPKP